MTSPSMDRAAALERAGAFIGQPLAMLIGGQWVQAQSGDTIDTLNPATGERLTSVPHAGKTDLDIAVAAGQAALDGPWRSMTASQRQRLIWRLGDLLEANAAEFAALETLDNGKPFSDALLRDVPAAANLFHYYAGWATKLNGETIAVSYPGEWHSYTLHEPVGVAGLILPWNAPLMMAASKLAPALAAGCTVVLKPAEQTPLTALRLGQLVIEAGIPPGVVNILTGNGSTLGQAIVDHPGISKISFTGSTLVGRKIVQTASQDFKRVTLELGGKSAVLIFPDADLSKAVPAAARAIFANSGQVCNAGSRLYVHADVYDQVLEGLVANAASLRVGPGMDADTQMGPVISETQLDRVMGYIDEGRRNGASIASGGVRLGERGYFIAPTVVVGTRPEMSIRREEIFGPVVCVMPFDGDEQLAAVAAEVNATSYGLGAHVWTRDLSRAHLLARRLHVGTVRVNGGGLDPALPFGGFKESGWGRENGRQGVEAFTELKSVMIGL